MLMPERARTDWRGHCARKCIHQGWMKRNGPAQGFRRQAGHLDGQAALHAGVGGGEGLHDGSIGKGIDNAVGMGRRCA